MRWFKYRRRYPNGSEMSYHIENAWLFTAMLVNLWCYDMVETRCVEMGETVSPVTTGLLTFIIVTMALKGLLNCVGEWLHPTDYWNDHNKSTNK